jgi:hypothetical protein
MCADIDFARPYTHTTNLCWIAMPLDDQQIASGKSRPIKLCLGTSNTFDLTQIYFRSMDICDTQIRHVQREAHTLRRDLQATLDLRDIN